ncbi:MAG: SO_0444 family Cu/Zn efflux transporter [bacterium]
MAPYLLLGYFIAGFLNLILSRDFVYKNLSGRGILSILKATLLGIPMPLCSCGVIPVSAHLEKQGASRGSVMSFLISTPTSGVDSIFATYALLGPFFALIRPIASFVGGITAGLVSNRVTREEKQETDTVAPVCDIAVEEESKSVLSKITNALRYGFFELVEDTSKWLIIGIIAGGLISFFVPVEFAQKYLSNGFISYPLMLLIAVPMYVCATGSIPIAAALILKGMSPGAGLIFLIAGPATNTATISFIAGKLGKKAVIIYLSTIMATAVIFALITDFFFASVLSNTDLTPGAMNMLPLYLRNAAGIVLLVLLARVFLVRIIGRMKSKTAGGEMYTQIKVSDMTCQHCVKTIKKALSEIEGIEDIVIDLDKGIVNIKGDFNRKKAEKVITEAGYTVE